jgi:arylsulfatase A-like enzyme
MHHWRSLISLACATIATATVAVSQERTPHNVILFVPDGLRALKVEPENAPTMAAIRDKGVNFKNSHSMFPTFTTANASAFATGHYLGDTGDYSNVIYTGHPIQAAGNSVTPFLEDDAVLGEVDQDFGGNYLNEQTILNAARSRGFSTAVIGKVGPVLIFDHTERSGNQTIVIDDATGTTKGIPPSEAFTAAADAIGLQSATPLRTDNAKVGDFQTPGTKVANVVQQDYFIAATTKVVLPLFKARKKPFVLIYWARDPDGTQHAQGDSLNTLMPGINGPTTSAAIKNTDDDLRRLQETLRDLGLAETTDVIVAADHGFATISKDSKTSVAARANYQDVPKGFLPPGFLAVDLAKGLGLSLFDPDANNTPVADDAHPKGRGNGLIGGDPSRPDVVVAANGGSDLIYLPNKDRVLAARIVDLLLAEDYVSGLFVDDDLGRIPGTLPLSRINFRGAAVTPRPAMVVNFRSFSTGCEEPLLCTVEVADTGLQQGQGMHGSFSRAETMNFMAAIGPDFKSGFIDTAPVSNVDVGKTIAHILGLNIPSRGQLVGRVMTEALPNGAVPHVVRGTLRSAPSSQGLRTVLLYQLVGSTRYFDAGGFPGRTVGLSTNVASQ